MSLLATHTLAVRVTTVIVTIALLFSAYSLVTADKKHGVAYFESVTSVYEHDKIRILGIEVGRIEKITPEKGRVRVDFSYDSEYELPADVKAAIVSPTLVATRFIQLAPAYKSGPKLADDGVIPMERTASPLEFDDLKSELSRLSTTLGPNEKDAQGSLANFLDASAKAGKGRGADFNRMVTNLSAALGALAEGRGDIFGTIRNLQVFVSAVAEMDDQVVEFNRRLSDVSDLLDDNAEELTGAIVRVDRAARLVETFLKTNRPQLKTATTQLGDLTSTLAASRDDLATLLHNAPNTVTNFYNMFSPRMMSFTGGLMFDNLATPGELACSLISNQFAQTGEASKGCGETIAPVLNQLGVNSLPVGVNGPLQGGGQSSFPDQPDEVGDSRPTDGGKSDIPGLNSGLSGLLMPGGTQ